MKTRFQQTTGKRFDDEPVFKCSACGWRFERDGKCPKCGADAVSRVERTTASLTPPIIEKEVEDEPRQSNR